MVNSGLIQRTGEQLQAYSSAFSPEVVDIASDLAGRQASMSHQQILEAANYKGVVHYPKYGSSPTHVMEFCPDDYDHTSATMVWLAMANPDDANQLHQLASVAMANPYTRFLAVANPSGPGYNTGLLHGKDLLTVAHGNLTPTVMPLIQFAKDRKIEIVNQAGFSLGVEKAHTAAAIGEFEVEREVVIEPVPVIHRVLPWLTIKFAMTGGPLKGYVEANEQSAFREARDDSVRMGSYMLGLARPTNIATALAMTKNLSMKRWKAAQAANPDMVSTFVWGDESELTVNRRMVRNVAIARQIAGDDKVHEIVARGGKHNLVNYLPFQVAAFTQGLRF